MHELAATADVVVMAAAVADFRPKVMAEGKLKKDQGAPEIVLEPTPDILVRAMVLAGFMGVVGGFLPAIRAARVSPIEAMRA